MNEPQQETKEVIVSEIDITNFELLRLLKNGGDLNPVRKTYGEEPVPQLFNVRVIRDWEKKLPKNRTMIGYKLQIITKGIDAPMERRDVIEHTKVEKVKIEVEKKKKTEDLIKFTEDKEETTLF